MLQNHLKVSGLFHVVTTHYVLCTHASSQYKHSSMIPQSVIVAKSIDYCIIQIVLLLLMESNCTLSWFYSVNYTLGKVYVYWCKVQITTLHHWNLKLQKFEANAYMLFKIESGTQYCIWGHTQCSIIIYSLLANFLCCLRLTHCLTLQDCGTSLQKCPETCTVTEKSAKAQILQESCHV